MATHSYRIGAREVTYTTRTRYAITYVPERGDLAGLRVLSRPNQGRYHYDTREAAEAALVAFKGPDGFPRVFTPGEVESLAVTEVECYEHGDATRTVFEGGAK